MGCQTLTMDRVVFEQVHKVVNIHEGIIDSGNNSLAGVFSEGRAEDETANSAEAVDTKFSDRHRCVCVFLFIKVFNLSLDQTIILIKMQKMMS